MKYLGKKIIQNPIIQNSLREYYLTITSLYIDEYSILMSELDELLDIKEDKCKEDKDLYKCNCRNIGFGFCFC